jgi:hypothetical protein
MSMTPTPDIEPIREGLARALIDKSAELLADASPPLRMRMEIAEGLSDACLTYLIKRQAFLYDVYERIKGEMK